MVVSTLSAFALRLVPKEPVKPSEIDLIEAVRPEHDRLIINNKIIPEHILQTATKIKQQ